MNQTAYERVVDTFRSYGCIVDEKGRGKAAIQAPGHSPADRSISVTQIEGQALVHCFSEDTQEVLERVGLTMADLFDEPKKGVNYKYDDGRVVHRSPDKKFFQQGNTKGSKLYRASKLDEAREIYFCEGEKDVHALESLGLTATTNAGGAGNIKNFDLTPLYGKRVVIVRDNDDAGLKHANALWSALAQHVSDIRVVTAAEGKDAADHVATGHSADDFVEDEAFATRVIQRELWNTWKQHKDDDPDKFLRVIERKIRRLKPAEDMTQLYTWDEALQKWFEWYEAPEEEKRVIPTPWPKLNQVLAGGFHAGRSYLVVARPGVGKAATLTQPIPTPTGWVKMGELEPGDQVYDENGKPCNVVATVTWHNRPVMRVHFNDGTYVDVDEEHEWLTETRKSQKNNPNLPTVKTTREIAATLKVDGRANHSITASYGLIIGKPCPTLRWYITNVEQLPGRHTTKCIQVDSPSHLFLIGESMVPTHNSLVLGNSALFAALEDWKQAALFSLEMGPVEIASRMIASGGEANYGQITKREIDDYNFQRASEFMNRSGGMPLIIGDTPDLTIDKAFNYVDALANRPEGLDIALFDYAQLIKGRGGQSNTEANEEVSRGLKVMSRMYNIPVVSAAQANRKAVQEGDAPGIDKIRGTGAYEQDADVIIILDLETEEQPPHMPTGMIDFIVAKNRTGPQQTISMCWRPHFAKINE